MTSRLYYDNSNLTEFKATIVDSRQVENRVEVILDHSAFYPTSGGQLHDIGFLDDTRVLDVRESDDGKVVHICDGHVAETGQTVVGKIDEERRWIHRQQHTAQHLLSHILYKHLGANTVSVHLGADYGAIEIDLQEINDDDLNTLETISNRMVRDNLKITTRFCSGSELENIPLRRPSKRTENIRIVQIGEVEYAACGGTHCDATGQIGLIKIAGVERLRGHAVIRFLAGIQASDDYSLRFKVIDELVRRLTCGIVDIPERIDSLISSEREARIQLVAAQKKLLPIMAGKIAQRKRHRLSNGIIFAQVDLAQPKMADRLALEVATITQVVTALVCSEKLIVASFEGGPDLTSWSKEIVEHTGLKGGGKGNLLQFGRLVKERIPECRAAMGGISSYD